MKNPYRKLKLALVPIGLEPEGNAALEVAKRLAEDVVLVGIVPVGEAEDISGGTQAARDIRKRLLALGAGPQVRYKSTVIVSNEPWADLKEVIANEKPDLLIADWKEHQGKNEISPKILLSNSIVDVILVRGSVDLQFNNTLVAVRGGPYAELALKAGLLLHKKTLDVLHLSLPGAENDAPFKGFEHILHQIPEIKPLTMVTDDVSKTLFTESKNYDLVILGSSASGGYGGPIIGSVAERLLCEASATVLIVKTHHEVKNIVFDERAGTNVISILVDKWFAENTYQAEEFSDLKRLVETKEKQGLTVSLALPALNEEKTVGKVISTIKNALMEKIPLLDEIVLIDSNSTDNTRKIAEDLGVSVYIHQQLLPELGARIGKGEALWKSLLVTKGDIIAWIDTDIVNIHPRFVYGILGPLLMDSNLQFVKAYYRRPLKVGNMLQAGGGGRVTELTARPLLNLFYPELSGVIQPLSGEYAGRRKALERLTFYSGYGVETGLLIDIFEQYGLGAIAQVDLLERIHHSQELEALSKMSFAIIQTVMHKLEKRYERSIIEDVNKSMKLIRCQRGEYSLVVEEIAERERPPMITLPQYHKRHDS